MAKAFGNTITPVLIVPIRVVFKSHMISIVPTGTFKFGKTIWVDD